MDLNKIKKIYASDLSPEDKLKFIHDNIKFNGNIKTKEYPEQLLSMKYIKPSDVVLEIGSNIGRNSCVISCILNNSENLLTLECNPTYLPTLHENKNNNKLKFKIEESAISKRKLMQKQMITKPSNELEEGFSWIKTITWDDLIKKYNMNFNVLVCDCEGAIYYILKDEPTFIDQFERIIFENDFLDDEQEKFTFNFLNEKGFNIIHKQGIKQWKPFTAKNYIDKKAFYVVFSR